MQTKSDSELLRDYAGNQSEAAFGEIVRRYADLVYSAALRQVGVAEQARDVAQTVFADLARKAGCLRANTLLIGWLYRGARLAALEELRNDRRRLERERQAMDLLNSSPEIPHDWGAVHLVLDEAIAQLSREERDALLLRFFQNKSLAAIGGTLGVSEDAAQKRVSRALGKLREFLARRGINTTASALSAALAANAVQAAPPGLAAALTASALASAAAGGSATPLLIKLFGALTMKTTILALILAGAFGALTVIQLNTSHQLREAQTIVQQQANEIASLRPATQQLLKQADELEQLRRLAQDVPGLRGQIAQLRREKADQKTVTAQTAEGQTNTPPNSEESPIVITAKFVSVPTEPLKAFGWSQAIARPGGIVYMADAEVRSASQDLATVEGMDFLNSQRVTTANGNAADLFAGETVPLGGTNASVGVSLHVNPHFSTNSFSSPSITLEFAAKLNQLIELSTRQGSFERGLRVTTITNSVSVLDGQTVVLREDIPEGDRVVGSTNLVPGPKSLLLFLTTQLVRDGYTQRLERVVHKD